MAAVGQCRLISLWDSLFAHMRQPVAQILLTRNDIADVRTGKCLNLYFPVDLNPTAKSIPQCPKYLP